jgi:CHRD domain
VDAAGHFSGTLSGRILHWRLTTSQMSGSIGVAVIHLGARGQTGARVVQICGKRGENASGTVVLTAAQANHIRTRSTYLIVGTPKHFTGEIRGQLIVQP